HDLPLESSTLAGFSPDRRWLATYSAHDGCRLWKVGTWEAGPRFGNAGFAFSPDGRLLALGDVLGAIRLVEPDTGREVVKLTGPEPIWYNPACFTPDGSRLVATCSGDKVLYVWDLRLLRERLRELSLDWDGPEFRPAPAGPPAPLAVQVDPGFLRGPAIPD